MNLLDTASLVVTPNGYKASKLYSIIPSDGTGDMTFARTGDTATRVNSSGLIESVLANKPRLDYLGSTCPKLLLEPQRTNLVAYSRDWSNAAWSKSNVTISADSVISPDGTQNADTMVEDSSASTQHRTLIYVSSSSNVHSFSIYAKNISGSRNAYVDLGPASAYYNFSTGVLTKNNCTGNVKDAGNGWIKIEITSNSAYNPIVVYVGLANGNNETYSGNGTSSIAFWGAQLEVGAYATSYIPTTTASVTRNAEQCYKSSISSLLGQTEGTAYVNFIYPKNASFCDVIALGNASDGLIEFQINGLNNSFNVTYYKGGVVVKIDSLNSLVVGNQYKVAFKYKTNNFALYINGVLQGQNTTATYNSSLAEISFNGYNTSLNNTENIIINNVAIWKTQLTNQELVTLTTI